MNIRNVGEGKVVLIAGGGKIYTEIAARFVKSERSIEEIIASPYDKTIVRKIINSGHKAAVEFDYFIFGVEGYSRVTEIQLVRKRLASYMIKTGRANKGGKRSFDMVIPKNIQKVTTVFDIPVDLLSLKNGTALSHYLGKNHTHVSVNINAHLILNIIESWYAKGIEDKIPEEDLRYIKPQATEFKALIGMNA
ncbi:MAG: FAD-dependent thymidylate synthase, partial [Desulfosporosinus sp.]